MKSAMVPLRHHERKTARRGPHAKAGQRAVELCVGDLCAALIHREDKGRHVAGLLVELELKAVSNAGGPECSV